MPPIAPVSLSSQPPFDKRQRKGRAKFSPRQSIQRRVGRDRVCLTSNLIGIGGVSNTEERTRLTHIAFANNSQLRIGQVGGNEIIDRVVSVTLGLRIRHKLPKHFCETERHKSCFCAPKSAQSSTNMTTESNRYTSVQNHGL